MSEQISFDRNKGFVALPVGIFDMDLSPGAFRTLVELCRMANTDGWCWPSLNQLSERLGRSRSAISGYLKDLRELNLITTQEQRTANGYNYRLKYQVTFWAEWRASLSGATGEKTERSVQPVERLEVRKNQSHKNQDRQTGLLDTLLSDWQTCFGKAPYPQAENAPSSQLIAKSNNCLDTSELTANPMSADIPSVLQQWRLELRLSQDEPLLKEHGEHIRALRFDDAELKIVLRAISKDWPPHWRNLPSKTQFEKMLKKTGVTSRARKLALLKSNLNRWRMAERGLRKRAASCSLAALSMSDRLAS